MAFKLEKLFILNQSYFFPLMPFSLLKQSSKNVPTVSIGWCKSFCKVLIFLARYAKKLCHYVNVIMSLCHYAIMSMLLIVLAHIAYIIAHWATGTVSF